MSNPLEERDLFPAAGSPAAGGNGSGVVANSPQDSGLPHWIDVLFKSVSELASIRKDRFTAAARRWTLQVVLAISLAIAGSLWLGSAVLATSSGMRGAFTALCGGREWAGDLGAGLSGLLLAALAGLWYARHRAARELVRLRAKYETRKDESAADPTPNA